MSDPGSSMSPAAVFLMAVVVLVLLGGWLLAVFRAARQPVSKPARPGNEGAGQAAGPGAGPHSQTAPAARSADEPS